MYKRRIMTSFISHSDWLKQANPWLIFFPYCIYDKHAIRNFLINDLVEFNQRGTKSIVLIELELESVVVDLESAKRRTGPGFSVICGGFLWLLAFFGGQGGLDEQVISGIDRVRRALSGTSITFVERVGVNRDRFF